MLYEKILDEYKDLINRLSEILQDLDDYTQLIVVEDLRAKLNKLYEFVKFKTSDNHTNITH